MKKNKNLSEDSINQIRGIAKDFPHYPYFYPSKQPDGKLVNVLEVITKKNCSLKEFLEVYPDGNKDGRYLPTNRFTVRKLRMVYAESFIISKVKQLGENKLEQILDKWKSDYHIAMILLDAYLKANEAKAKHQIKNI